LEVVYQGNENQERKSLKFYEIYGQ
ncbi:MAG: hypothetical protein RLZZ361_1381, partial [Cyanobacteriota bacterium]